ncbi:hypothetical protein DFJ74DRAFT_705475 [Hyaloraphidium curvatum]|nr:hypothetical protein DFJ74DRAFT_705475 [Hyaloraphidium curvatum]
MGNIRTKKRKLLGPEDAGDLAGATANGAAANEPPPATRDPPAEGKPAKAKIKTGRRVLVADDPEPVVPPVSHNRETISPTANDAASSELPNLDDAKQEAIGRFLDRSLLFRTFACLQIHIDVFGDEASLEVVERFLFRRLVTFLGAERHTGMIDGGGFPLYVTGIAPTDQIGVARLSVSSTMEGKDAAHVFVIQSTGETIQMSEEAYESLRTKVDVIAAHPEDRAIWARGVDGPILAELAARYILANMEWEQMSPVIKQLAALRDNSPRSVADAVAVAGGFRGMQNYVAETIADCRTVDQDLFEILPACLQEPLLVLRLTGEIGWEPISEERQSGHGAQGEQAPVKKR